MVSHIKPEKVVTSVANWMQTQIDRGDHSIPIEQCKHWKSALSLAARHIPTIDKTELEIKRLCFYGIKASLEGLRACAILKNEKDEVSIFSDLIVTLERLNPEPINPEPPLKGA